MQTAPQRENTRARDEAAQRVGRFRRMPAPVRKVLIAVLGGGLMLTAMVLGPLPGPGGIPLFLGGIAVLATEFHWAHRLWSFFRRLFDHYLGWPRWQRYLFWVVVVVVAWLGIWAWLSWSGVPTWLPRQMIDALRLLPLVN